MRRGRRASDRTSAALEQMADGSRIRDVNLSSVPVGSRVRLASSLESAEHLDAGTQVVVGRVSGRLNCCRVGVTADRTAHQRDALRASVLARDLRGGSPPERPGSTVTT
jgi:hypothetical protein